MKNHWSYYTKSSTSYIPKLLENIGTFKSEAQNVAPISYWANPIRFGQISVFLRNVDPCSVMVVARWTPSMVSLVGTHIRRIFTTSSAISSTDLVAANNLPFQIYETNLQIKELVKCSRVREARVLFDKMPRRDEVSYTNIISGYMKDLDYPRGWSLFHEMRADPSCCVDPFVLSGLLKACGLNMDVNHGKLLHSLGVKTGLVNSVFVGSALLDMYMKVDNVLDGCRVFDEMPSRNVVSWTAIISGLVHCGFFKDALSYFSEMWRSKVKCDSYTFSSALKGCAGLGSLNRGREIHALAIKEEFHETSYVSNTLASMYDKCGKLDYVLRLFQKISSKDVVSWTLMIGSYVQIGQEELAVQTFREMRQSGVSPNEYTFSAVISGCATLARIQWGKQLHSHVIVLGIAESLSVANSIMVLYSKCGQLNCASVVFGKMSSKDIVSWSAIITGHTQAGDGEEAFELLSAMRKEGAKPNEFAFASLLSVCGNMAILEQGKQLHAYIISIGLDNEAQIQSALVNMYAKCGVIEEAARIFNASKDYDIVSWTAMINGYAEHGYSREAIDLFEKISMVDLIPDSVTFIGVLTACNHAGLVDLGLDYFNSISNEYHMNPTKEHYGCMIDLLCRAGRLRDAENMIENMPCTQDDVVWSTLLRACRLHGDVDRGRRATEKILQLDPNSAGAHATLANIYASKGRWREMGDVRKLMRSKGVIKEPGWSWIKIKDRVSAFVAGDRVHSHSDDIYGVLDLLASATEISVQESESVISDMGD